MSLSSQHSIAFTRFRFRCKASKLNPSLLVRIQNLSYESQALLDIGLSRDAVELIKLLPCYTNVGDLGLYLLLNGHRFCYLNEGDLDIRDPTYQEDFMPPDMIRIIDGQDTGTHHFNNLTDQNMVTWEFDSHYYLDDMVRRPAAQLVNSWIERLERLDWIPWRQGWTYNFSEDLAEHTWAYSTPDPLSSPQISLES